MNAEWMEVEELVRQAQTGDREAFGKLFERFQGHVTAVARKRMRDADEAGELVQEVFLHAMKKIGQLREPAAFGAWLQRITVRVAINRATRKPPLPTAAPEVFERGDVKASNPLDSLLASEQRDRVRDAVANLREMDRDALVAFYLKGQSLVEIADEFEVPLGTVKRRLHVARNRLEEALRDGGSGDLAPAGVPADGPKAPKPRTPARPKLNAAQPANANRAVRNLEPELVGV